MKKSIFSGPLSLGAALLMTTVPAWSQPDPANAPKGTNPPNWAQQPGQNWRDMTPEQRAAAQKQMVAGILRRAMTASEITDAPTQDALLAYIEAEEKARIPVQEAAQKVIAALIPGAEKPKVEDAVVATAMQAYRDAVKADATRREAALEALDNTLNWRTMPRLDAFLTLAGYTSEPGLLSGGVGSLMGGGGAGGGGGLGALLGMGGRGGPGGGGPGGGGNGGRGGGNGGRGGGNGGRGGGNGGGNGGNGGRGGNGGNRPAPPADAPPADAPPAPPAPPADDAPAE